MAVRCIEGKCARILQPFQDESNRSWGLLAFKFNRLYLRQAYGMAGMTVVPFGAMQAQLDHFWYCEWLSFKIPAACITPGVSYRMKSLQTIALQTHTLLAAWCDHQCRYRKTG